MTCLETFWRCAAADNAWSFDNFGEPIKCLGLELRCICAWEESSLARFWSHACFSRLIERNLYQWSTWRRTLAITELPSLPPHILFHSTPAHTGLGPTKTFENRILTLPRGIWSLRTSTSTECDVERQVKRGVSWDGGLAEWWETLKKLWGLKFSLF